jgi:ABC-2 type transport system ATP-binding protein
VSGSGASAAAGDGMPASAARGTDRAARSSGDAGPAVMVHDTAKAFGATQALDGVSLDVAPGELFGFIGPDGAGKTTLFRILATLLVADRGTARVLGFDVHDDMWEIRSRVGYMPGRFSLYPDLTVAENLDFFASVFGTTTQAAYDVIAPIYGQIEPFRDRRAGALSGGMKQKLALSCALVHRPDILLLDEPTTGVDAVSRREFWDLLAGLRDGGLTILVSTPYMDEADRCDRVALIQAGRILQIAEPAAVGADYPLPLFAVTGPDRYRMLQLLRAYPSAASVYPFGAELHYTDLRTDTSREEIAAGVRSHLREHGFGAAAVAPIAAGIEDSFMARMGAPVGA